jgi:hypothetical protein
MLLTLTCTVIASTIPKDEHEKRVFEKVNSLASLLLFIGF